MSSEQPTTSRPPTSRIRKAQAAVRSAREEAPSLKELEWEGYDHLLQLNVDWASSSTANGALVDVEGEHNHTARMMAKLLHISRMFSDHGFFDELSGAATTVHPPETRGPAGKRRDHAMFEVLTTTGYYIMVRDRKQMGCQFWMVTYEVQTPDGTPLTSMSQIKDTLRRLQGSKKRTQAPQSAAAGSPPAVHAGVTGGTRMPQRVGAQGSPESRARAADGEGPSSRTVIASRDQAAGPATPSPVNARWVEVPTRAPRAGAQPASEARATTISAPSPPAVSPASAARDRDAGTRPSEVSPSRARGDVAAHNNASAQAAVASDSSAGTPVSTHGLEAAARPGGQPESPAHGAETTASGGVSTAAAGAAPPRGTDTRAPSSVRRRTARPAADGGAARRTAREGQSGEAGPAPHASSGDIIATLKEAGEVGDELRKLADDSAVQALGRAVTKAQDAAAAAQARHEESCRECEACEERLSKCREALQKAEREKRLAAEARDRRAREREGATIKRDRAKADLENGEAERNELIRQKTAQWQELAALLPKLLS